MSWLDGMGAFGHVLGGMLSPAGEAINLLGGGDDVKGLYGQLFNRPGQEQAQQYLGQGQPYLDPATMKMLQDRAMGNGPSIAGDAFRNASQQGMTQQLAMSRNAGSSGAGRMAAQNMGNINQGMANGYATARNAEMQGASGQYLQAQQGNQQAWLDILKQLMGGKTEADNINGIIQGAAQAGQMVAKM